MSDIVVFHPDIHEHESGNPYTHRVYGLLSEEYDVRPLEWFIRHPFAGGVRCLYLNWYENTIGGNGAGENAVLLQKFQYLLKRLLLDWARFRGIRIVYVVHNKTPHNLTADSPVYQKAVRPFVAAVLGKADVIGVLNRHTVDYLEEEFGPLLLTKGRSGRKGPDGEDSGDRGPGGRGPEGKGPDGRSPDGKVSDQTLWI